MRGAPDLIEPVAAFRAWRIVGDALLSPYIPARWEGRTMHAECFPANRRLEFGHGWLAEPHRSPHRACRCGIYAYYEPGTRTWFGEFDWVEGVVACWGRIEAHATGLRGEVARVEALALPARPDRARDRAIHAIAGRLRCPVIAPEDQQAVADAVGAPVPARLRGDD
jgi:hypothetical protein